MQVAPEFQQVTGLFKIQECMANASAQLVHREVEKPPTGSGRTNQHARFNQKKDPNLGVGTKKKYTLNKSKWSCWFLVILAYLSWKTKETGANNFICFSRAGSFPTTETWFVMIRAYENHVSSFRRLYLGKCKGKKEWSNKMSHGRKNEHWILVL